MMMDSLRHGQMHGFHGVCEFLLADKSPNTLLLRAELSRMKLLCILIIIMIVIIMVLVVVMSSCELRTN